MSNYHFISYSSVDAQEFAFKLYDSLLAGQPSIPVWLDKREIKPGQDYDKQIVEAIRICDSMIFVMTPDSVEDESGCKLEWTWALKYKKAIIPLRLHPNAEMPFLMGSRHYIDFTGDFDTGLKKLRSYLIYLVSPEGVLQSLKDRLASAQRNLRRASDTDQEARIQNEIALLEKQIEHQQHIIDEHKGAAKRDGKSDTKESERDPQPEIKTPSEKAIFQALEYSKWDWRTIEGLQIASGMTEKQVQFTLDKYSKYIMKSAIQNKNGNDLYMLRSHYKKMKLARPRGLSGNTSLKDR